MDHAAWVRWDDEGTWRRLRCFADEADAVGWLAAFCHLNPRADGVFLPVGEKPTLKRKRKRSTDDGVVEE